MQLLDQLGGVHLEGLGELADGARVGFVHAAALELDLSDLGAEEAALTEARSRVRKARRVAERHAEHNRS